jgi:hypothetical protein
VYRPVLVYEPTLRPSGCDEAHLPTGQFAPVFVVAMQERSANDRQQGRDKASTAEVLARGYSSLARRQTANRVYLAALTREGINTETGLSGR